MKNDVGMMAWRGFLTAHARVVGRLEEELEDERDLALTWYDVLVQLQEAADHRLRMTELAGAVLLSKSGLTRLVDRMCAAGLVERCADSGDRRGRWVILTEAGHMRLRDAATVHLRGVREHFIELLSDDDAERLARVFATVVEHAAFTPGPPPRPGTGEE